MKCENCGKNEATCHYSSNINGEITRKDLCAECAEKFERENDLFGDIDGMFRRMDGMFSNFFRELDPWRGDFMTPTMVLPRLGRMLGLSSGAQAAESPAAEARSEAKAEPAPSGKKAEVKADDILARHRKINALREQMRKAAVAEEYEEAARLRDEIRALEAQDAA